MTTTIADGFVQARGVTNQSVKHLVTSERFDLYVKTGYRLVAMCGRDVEWDDPVEPSRTCSRCLGKVTGSRTRSITSTVTVRHTK